MSDIRSELAQAIEAAITEAGGTLAAADILNSFGKPPKAEMGDIAFPTFPLARQLRKAPPMIAQSLAETLKESLAANAGIAEVLVAGPYVNFKLDTADRAKRIVGAALEADYGKQSVGAGKTIGIDFSSPNIAKPFGIGHLRSTAIGNATGNLFRELGYRVVGVNHLGDWGTQFGKLMAAFELWGDNEKLDADPIQHLYELYVKFHKDAEENPQLIDDGRAWFRRLEEGDTAAHEYWSRFRALSLREFERIYDRLGVSFDHYWGEAHYNDMLEAVIEDVEKAGISEISEGALVVPMGEDMPPCLIRKSDGATLYATRDLAAARYRYEQLGFERFLYVVGTAQSVHFKQVFEVLSMMGYDWAKQCVHVNFGLIQGISTRKGTLVFLDDIIEKGKNAVREIVADRDYLSAEEKELVAEQVAIGAIVFYDLSRNRIKDYEFNWDLMLRGLRPGEPGRTGPYLQYTHVRAQSVEARFEEAHGALPANTAIPFELLKEDAAQALIAELERFPKVIAQAAEAYEPSMLSRYLLDLAGALNAFYSGGFKIVSEDAALSSARVGLVKAVRQTLGRGLAILGVPRPERM